LKAIRAARSATAPSRATAWDVTGRVNATGNSVPVQLWSYGGGANQQWMPVAQPNGYYWFVARHSGKCLDVPADDPTNGVQLQQYDCNGTGAQLFRLEPQP